MKHLSEKILPSLLKDKVQKPFKMVVYKLSCLYGDYLPSQDELNADAILIAKSINIDVSEFDALSRYVESKLNFKMNI